ncbi:hypothetical protein CU097_013372 [Rhizopus azygosporus]|uniref:proline--tRNA ligase n=2 Tax=Rhizopus TaxID=4842 RepID=A0A367K364_RHIAZ|nr:hypothetical protein CU097_013372 [Rhizopus azygosporus]
MLRQALLSSRVRTQYQTIRHFSFDGRNRLSSYFMPSTKDKATSDSLQSHALLLQSGMIRQSGAGIYSLLPLGLRVIEKIEQIVDEEMRSIGSQKLSLPILLNPDDWKKTGRWDGAAGEFFRLKDRKESDLLLAPTHEEEITRLVAHEIRSPKHLPIRLYQIGRKYRDELRPRAGLLRGREFIMKDLYSFDDSVEAAFETYEQVREAYKRIFTRIGVPFVVAEADSGNIGGSKSHEYHLVSQVGEDTLLTCSGCGYTANEELAVGKLTTTNQQCDETKENAVTALIKNSVRLNQTSVDATVVSFYEPNDTKEGIQGYAAVLTPPGRSANLLKVQTKLSKHLKKTQQLGQVSTIEMKILSEEVLKQIPSSTLVSQLHLFLDDSISNVATDSLSSKITVHPADHFRIAKEGDRCTSCDSELSSVKAIECGHTFYLGTKYSSALDCGYRKPNGEKVFAEMGCYGIGITRLLAAVAEARYDKRGIVWPRSLAPYKVCIIPTDDRKAEFKEMAEKVYDKLNKTFKGDIVIDDRRSGFGAKMKDAELIGYPFTVVVGQKSLTDESLVELHERVQYQESTKSEVCLDDLEKGFLVE